MFQQLRVHIIIIEVLMYLCSTPLELQEGDPTNYPTGQHRQPRMSHETKFEIVDSND
jgi:hypothetical protein